MAYDPAKSRWAGKVLEYGSGGAQRGMRVIVYGEYGVGKTTFAATFPKPFFVDIDLGETNKTRDLKLKYLTFKPTGIYTGIKNVLEDFLAKRDVFDPDGGPLGDRETVVIDSWTKVNEYILEELCRAGIGASKSVGSIDIANDRPAISQYGFLATRQGSIVSILKEITATGRNVVITALPMVEGSEEEKKTAKSGEMKTTFDDVIGVPNLVGKYKYAIGAEFDELYYLEQAQTGSTRYLHTTRHGIWRAKTRQTLPAVITNPSYDVIQKLLEANASKDAK